MSKKLKTQYLSDNEVAEIKKDVDKDVATVEKLLTEGNVREADKIRYGKINSTFKQAKYEKDPIRKEKLKIYNMLALQELVRKGLRNMPKQRKKNA